jgi:hypothetical protein
VDVCLSVTPAGKDETSIFDEWNRVVGEAKHDLNREVLLRLTLAAAGSCDFDMGSEPANVSAPPTSSCKSARARFSSLAMIDSESGRSSRLADLKIKLVVRISPAAARHAAICLRTAT